MDVDGYHCMVIMNREYKIKSFKECELVSPSGIGSARESGWHVGSLRY